MTDQADYQTIRIEKKGEADWLTFNRPDQMNTINLAMAMELNDYFGRLYHDGSVRIVVMQGSGRAFCAGLDIKERHDGSGETMPFGGGFGFQGLLADVYIKMRRCPQVIVSLVHGPACGGGFAFALASDIRIAGESARMNAAFIKIGLTSCDMGVSYFLPRLIGASLAAELMMTGDFIHAPRALATGLVSRVVPDDQLPSVGEEFVEKLLAASPIGLRMTKEGLAMAIDAPSLEAAMAIENRNQLMSSRSEDFGEGMRAFLEKRKPVYKNR
ncbi:MAG: enoyl-CoA hydratase/isomerase family protein [Caulobacter sp.]|jgi:enoyl-CoA hydratase/carnithine racemase|nr:enoyl-CoA hydratase/isomerase family protein [Caulobacter sp.]